MRDFRFFAVLDDEEADKLKISAIHDEPGYRQLRQMLSEQYNLGSREPDLQVWNVDVRGDRSLTIRHFQHQRRPLGNDAEKVMQHLAYLWGFVVRLETVGADGQVEPLFESRYERRRGN